MMWMRFATEQKRIYLMKCMMKVSDSDCGSPSQERCRTWKTKHYYSYAVHHIKTCNNNFYVKFNDIIRFKPLCIGVIILLCTIKNCSFTTVWLGFCLYLVSTRETPCDMYIMCQGSHCTLLKS